MTYHSYFNEVLTSLKWDKSINIYAFLVTIRSLMAPILVMVTILNKSAGPCMEKLLPGGSPSIVGLREIIVETMHNNIRIQSLGTSIL